ncbi:MAG TPA: acyltransferase [Burkholderiales bacterium]
MGVLRLLLALLVVYAHCVYPFGRIGVSADNAVEIFYMISGFYMTLVLRDKYAVPGGEGLRAFYINRALRLFPAYLLVAGVTLLLCLFGARLFGWAPQPAHYVAQWHAEGVLDAPKLVWLGLTQISMLGLESFNFFNLTRHGDLTLITGTGPSMFQSWRLLLVPQAWSLSVELYFYMVAPFLVTRGLKWIITVALASFIVRVAVWQLAGLNEDPWSYRFFPSELMFFLLGAVACRIYALRRENEAKAPPWYIALLLAGFAAIAVVIGRIGTGFHPGNLIAPLVTAAAFLALPRLFAQTKSNRVDRALGELSYPVYVSHVLVIWIVGQGSFDVSGGGFLLAAALVLVVATLVYQLVDLPIDRWRHAWAARRGSHAGARAPATRQVHT